MLVFLFIIILIALPFIGYATGEDSIFAITLILVFVLPFIYALFVDEIDKKSDDIDGKIKKCIQNKTDKYKKTKEQYACYLRECDKQGKIPLTYAQWKLAYEKNTSQSEI